MENYIDNEVISFVSKKIKYKNFIGEYYYSFNDDEYIGKLINISDLITFGGKDNDVVEESFKDAVNDYMFLCDDVKINNIIINEEHYKELYKYEKVKDKYGDVVANIYSNIKTKRDLLFVDLLQDKTEEESKILNREWIVVNECLNIVNQYIDV